MRAPPSGTPFTGKIQLNSNKCVILLRLEGEGFGAITWWPESSNGAITNPWAVSDNSFTISNVTASGNELTVTGVFGEGIFVPIEYAEIDI